MVQAEKIRGTRSVFLNALALQEIVAFQDKTRPQGVGDAGAMLGEEEG